MRQETEKNRINKGKPISRSELFNVGDIISRTKIISFRIH